MDAGKHAYLAAQLGNAALRASRTGSPTFSKFLDPAEAQLAEQAARKQQACVTLFGGTIDAERCVAAFTDGPPDRIEDLAWPIVWLRFAWDARYGSLEHRDLLGALMAQGIDRANLGDLLMGQGEAYCAALPDMAQYLASALTTAGRVTLTCSMCDTAPQLPEPAGMPHRDTVASLRLDALVAAGFDRSRGDAAELVRQGRVRLNHRLEQRVDAQVTEGALISVRGLGRVRLTQVGAENRKGRFPIDLIRYGVRT